MKVRNYQDLIAWQKAMDVVVEVYTISKAFPREEVYGLTSQLRRAAVSVPSNILRVRADERPLISFDIYQSHMDRCERLRLKR